MTLITGRDFLDPQSEVATRIPSKVIPLNRERFVDEALNL